MGYIRHHALVVTSYDRQRAVKAREFAISLDMKVSQIIESVTNCYYTFLVGPDGSKEGWEESDTGDERRKKFIAWLFKNHDDGNMWAEVQYGDDNGVTKIVNHSDLAYSQIKTDYDD